MSYAAAVSSNPQLSPGLQNWADESLTAMQAIGQVAHYARGETIFSDGEDALYCYKVISGTIRLCKLLSDGRRQIAEFLHPGDFFGFELRDNYALTAEALEDAVVVRFVRSRLDRLSDERRDVQRQMIALLSRDLCAAQDHLLLLGRQTAKERVASFLLSLGARSGTRNGMALDIPMCRQDIADYLGLTIETVCRAISELKRSRLIGVPSRNQIVLLNIAALRETAGADA